MKTFWKGMITGAGLMLTLVLVMLAVKFFNERDRKIYEAMELQYEIQERREDYGNRDAVEFLDTLGVRGAADTAIEQFRQQRDGILQRRRSEGDS
jgi:hypothetical protein